MHISITELPSPHCEVFKELAQLAFDALQTDTIVFTLAEIRSSCPNLSKVSVNWNGLGLLKAVHYFNRIAGNEDVTFHFLHFSIQEYMAAYYISKLSNSKQLKLLKRTFWEHRYYNTWIMYVGITSAASFALKHFLSGNAVQLHTRVSSNLIISSKLLNDKIKCLHLFQCLEETENEDIASLVGKFFQYQEIDLSNQTLLPTDINIIGFFLCRSITKRWNMINFSKCNIGVTGCEILCNRFMGKDSRNIVTVNKIDLSFNQLTPACLLRLFDLFKAWHTSEVIITDDALHNDITDHKLYITVEKTLMLSEGNDPLNLLLIGSFLFVKKFGIVKMFEILSNVTSIKSIYLIQCSWELHVTSADSWVNVLEKQKLHSVHIVGTAVNENFIVATAAVLSRRYEPVNLFIYDPSLHDEIGKRIENILIYKNSLFDCKLVITSSKIHGTVNISPSILSDKLSPIEIMNSVLCVTSFDHVQFHPWKQYNECKLLVQKLIENTAYKATWSYEFPVLLFEGNTLLVSKVSIEDIVKFLGSNIDSSKSLMVLRNCNLCSSSGYYSDKNVFAHCTVLCLINCELNEYVMNIHHCRSTLQELFIHGVFCNVSTNALVKIVMQDCHLTSSLVVTNGIMITHNPTAKQIALAFQLEPSITVWKLPNYQVVFYQIISWFPVLLFEGNTLLASKASIEGIVTLLGSNIDNSKSLMVLRNCNSCSASDYYSDKNVFAHCTVLCLINCELNEYVMNIHHCRSTLQELFIHGVFYNVSTNALVKIVTQDCHLTSSVVVTNGMMIGHNPTTKQIALAFQLEPSITVWKLPNCQVTADVFYQIISWLTTLPSIELDFKECNITDTGCEIFYQYLKLVNSPLPVKTLVIPTHQLTTSIISNLIEIVIIWKVQKLCIFNAHRFFCNCFRERLAGLTCRYSKPSASIYMVP